MLNRLCSRLNKVVCHDDSHLSTSEYVDALIEKPFYHRGYAHRRTLLVLFGFALCAIGVTLTADPRSGFLFFSISFALEIGTFVWLMRPCQCGQAPVLTAKLRARLGRSRKTNSWRFYLLYVMFGVLIGYFLSVIAIFALTSYIRSDNVLAVLETTLHVLSGLSIACGGVLITSSLTNKIDWLCHNLVISDKEVAHIAHLKGDTTSELHDMINFHLKAGNVAAAEQLSRNLITVAENERL